MRHVQGSPLGRGKSLPSPLSLCFAVYTCGVASPPFKGPAAYHGVLVVADLISSVVKQVHALHVLPAWLVLGAGGLYMSLVHLGFRRVGLQLDPLLLCTWALLHARLPFLAHRFMQAEETGQTHCAEWQDDTPGMSGTKGCSDAMVQDDPLGPKSQSDLQKTGRRDASASAVLPRPEGGTCQVHDLVPDPMATTQHVLPTAAGPAKGSAAGPIANCTPLPPPPDGPVPRPPQPTTRKPGPRASSVSSFAAAAGAGAGASEGGVTAGAGAAGTVSAAGAGAAAGPDRAAANRAPCGPPSSKVGISRFAPQSTRTHSPGAFLSFGHLLTGSSAAAASGLQPAHQAEAGPQQQVQQQQLLLEASAASGATPALWRFVGVALLPPELTSSRATPQPRLHDAGAQLPAVTEAHEAPSSNCSDEGEEDNAAQQHARGLEGGQMMWQAGPCMALF